MAGPDAGDPASTRSEGLSPVAPVAQPASLRGLRVGVLHLPANTFPDVEPVYAAGAGAAAGGGRGAGGGDPPGRAEARGRRTDRSRDRDEGRHERLPRRAPRRASERDPSPTSSPSTSKAQRKQGYFGQDLFEASEATKGLDDPAYRAARAEEVRLAGAEGLDNLLREHDLAVLIAPTSTPAWKSDLLYGDGNGASSSAYPAMAGYPHVTVPMGLLHALPVGLSFIGPGGADDRVLAVAAAWEAISGGVPPPAFPASVDPTP